MTLEERIRARLSAVPVTNALSVHVLVDGFVGPSTTHKADGLEPSEDILDDAGSDEARPAGTLNEFLRYRRLILLFQNQADQPSTSANGGKKRPAVSMQAFLQSSAKQAVCVVGMCVCEYAAKEEPDHIVRSYIQYVDTTGLFEPRREQSAVTKALVAAYVDFVRGELRGSFMHLLALAQPNFLFPGSEHFPGKRVLPTGDLVQWWLRTLTQGLIGCPSEDRTVIHAYTPERYGASEQSIHEEMFGELTGTDGLSFHYGFPFRAGELVDDVVPFFEDDPKWRLYQQLYARKPRRSSAVYELAEDDDQENSGNAQDEDENVDIEENKGKGKNGPKRTVQEFVDALTTRAEFFKDPDGTFIVVEFVGNEQRRLQRLRERCTEAASKGKQMLFAMNFSDAASIVASSSKLLPWMRFMGSQGVSIPSNLHAGRHSLSPPLEEDSENCAKRVNLTNL